MTLHIGIPQLIYVALWVIGIIYEGLKHGEPKEGEHNVWVYLVMFPIYIGLLYWGGFFR
jgi:hypothetical protein